MSDEEDPLREDPLIGKVLADRYLIERRLGRGGMGDVYLAEHVRMRKPFAVKILRKEMALISEAAFRFEREALASGRADHRNLVTATDFGKLEDGALYLVLEYVAGESLGTLLERGPLPEGQALRIARQIAEALGALHAAGVVHRDVKPDNVMLVNRDGEELVKLLDFGMAKVQMERASLVPEITQVGFVFGTPRFMAPEQAAGSATDHRSDLYSLGIVLYAMLAGAPPFSGEDIRETLHMQRFDPPPPLPETTDPGVQELVVRLLSKDPKDRVQTAEEVVAQIDALMGREQIRRTEKPETAKGLAWLGQPVGLFLIGLITALAFGIGYLGVRRSTHAPVPIAGEAYDAGGALASAPAPGSARRTSGGTRALAGVLRRAEAGDTAALEELEARPDGDRSARQWFVLGVARVDHGRPEAGLSAYLRAIEAEPSYASKWTLVSDIAALTDHPDAWEDALRAAAALPGPEGADILFSKWVSTPDRTPSTELAKELLESDGVRARASEAVKIAIDLRNAHGRACEERRALLPRAVRYADTRSLRPLLILNTRHGCGISKRSDCFPCLREDNQLDRAIEAAKGRMEPDYSGARPPG